MEIVSREQAAALIYSGATIVPGGFGSCGHPDGLTQAIEKRFLETGHPHGLGLLFASGAGDACREGLNRFAHDGMVSSAVGDSGGCARGSQRKYWKVKSRGITGHKGWSAGSLWK